MGAEHFRTASLPPQIFGGNCEPAEMSILHQCRILAMTDFFRQARSRSAFRVLAVE